MRSQVPPEYLEYHRTGQWPRSFRKVHRAAVGRLFAPPVRLFRATAYGTWVPGPGLGEFTQKKRTVTGLDLFGYPVVRVWGPLRRTLTNPPK